MNDAAIDYEGIDDVTDPPPLPASTSASASFTSSAR